MTDPISDYLTRIRNASQALKRDVEIPHSKAKESLSRILKDEGYIQDYEVLGEKKKTIKLKLKFAARKSAITGLKRVSKPGIRTYVGSDAIPRVLGGLGVAVISTSRGLMPGHSARKNNLGGEVVCYVW